MKKFFSDFKAFAMKGNVVDMAVGVIIGSAFGKIVTSLVNDIITPLISLAIGKMDLTGLEIVFRAGTVDPATGETVGKVALTYGNFIQSVIDFLIIAMCIFVVLRLITNAEKKIESLTKKKEEEKAEEEEEAKETELDILREIRDMMKKENGGAPRKRLRTVRQTTPRQTRKARHSNTAARRRTARHTYRHRLRL